MIKTFRGKIASGSERTIRLGTIRGEIGYKIVKFQILPDKWGGTTGEFNVKLFTVSGQTAAQDINFENSYLLGIAAMTYNTSANIAGDAPVVIFDHVKFNQDIFVVAHDNDANDVNYYLELEQVKLDLNEATVATLKDMRGS